MPRRRMSTHLTRAGATAVAAGAVVAMAAAPASAHVTVTPDTTDAGAYAVLTFSVPHGCEGSPTTKVAIAMPEEIPQVTATRNPLWSLQVRSEPLAEPIEDAHGNRITERESVVIYTARTPLPDGERDTMELSVQLPDAAGETLAFPVVQTCAKGETAWTETAAEGQDPEELEHPAPTVTITGATEEGDAAEASAEVAASTEPATEDEDDDGSGLALAGLGAGILGILLGGAALVRGRKA